VGVFTPAAFASRSPVRPTQSWFCTVTAQHGVEYRREDVGPIRKLDLPRETFLVNGALPRPAP
jgi:hypothetical protein